MSYCRFMEGDVYAYACDGGVQFFVADGRRELDRMCSTFNEAYQYAKELRDMHGLDVPSHAIEALEAEAMAELEDENAKLRELVRELWSCAASLAEDSVYHIEGAVCGCGISCVVNGEDCSAYKLRDRMRELGLEVE